MILQVRKRHSWPADCEAAIPKSVRTGTIQPVHFCGGDRAVNEALTTLREFSASMATEQPAPQQKQVAVLLATVYGVAAGLESGHALETSQVPDAVWHGLNAAIVAQGGKVDRRMGGTVTALFGSNVQREDETEQEIGR